MKNFVLQPIPENMIDWLYTNCDKDKERQCLGHLRGDFGRDGNEFWTKWFPHVTVENVDMMVEFRKIMLEITRRGELLYDFATMRKLCREGTPIDDRYGNCTGFVIVTDRFLYAIRCTPMRGDYNFYIYCYDLEDRR